MDDRQINRYLRKQFAPMGWTLVIYYLIMNVAVGVVAFADSFYQSAVYGTLDENALMGNGWGYILAVAIGYVILRLWKKKDFFKEQIWAKGKPMNVGSFLGLLCLCLGTQYVSGIFVSMLEEILNQFDKSLMQIMESTSGQSDTFSMFLYVSIFAPITEELLFRGVIQRSLMPYGKKFAIFCSAFLFGLFHGNLVQTPYAFLVGLVLGYVAAEYSIAWAMVLHMFNNLVVADMMDRLTRGLPEAVATLLLGLLILAAAIASVVILIVKRREVGDYLNRECMDKRCVKWFFCNAGVITLIVLMLGNILLTMSVL